MINLLSLFFLISLLSINKLLLSDDMKSYRIISNTNENKVKDLAVKADFAVQTLKGQNYSCHFPTRSTPHSPSSVFV